jgi:uncharacterized protein
MRTRGAFVFPVHNLDRTGQNADFPVSAAWLRGALEGCEMQPAGPDGRCHVLLTKTGNDVLVQGQLDVELAVPCARCLGRVELRPHVELTLLLHPASGSDEGPEGPDDEADVDSYEDEEVVLDRFVREAILLESPTFPLCSEACEGIRPASESVSQRNDAATDPRLLPLLELAKRRNWKE